MESPTHGAFGVTVHETFPPFPAKKKNLIVGCFVHSSTLDPPVMKRPIFLLQASIFPRCESSFVFPCVLVVNGCLARRNRRHGGEQTRNSSLHSPSAYSRPYRRASSVSRRLFDKITTGNGKAMTWTTFRKASPEPSMGAPEDETRTMIRKIIYERPRLQSTPA